MYIYQCMQCKNLCAYRWSLCDNCRKKAEKEKEDYLNYLKEVNKNAK